MISLQNNLETLLQALIAHRSITPDDAACQETMIHLLESIGFECQRLNHSPVSNFFARFGGQGPLLMFAGHTDVVPVGDESKWHSDPFVLTNKQGLLYGRGAADMKGSCAAMLIAAQRFVSTYPTASGSLSFLITSGEEGDHFHLGTEYAMAQLHQAGIKPDFCIVGEPSSQSRIGDVVKIGRRGSLTGKVVIRGIQGHVAYPHLAKNPIHTLSPVLLELTTTPWDEGNDHFPPTSLQVTHIHAGGQANNIIPGEACFDFNIRFSSEQTEASLKKQILDIFDKHQLNAETNWRLNGNPFLTSHGKLLEATQQAILQHTGKQPTLSTSGGTSDGRFIAPYDIEVIELGPVNATIHQVNECVSLSDLETLSNIYYSICELICLT
jgi:succinyl-diaminopimelate desuccinylase